MNTSEQASQLRSEGAKVVENPVQDAVPNPPVRDETVDDRTLDQVSVASDQISKEFWIDEFMKKQYSEARQSTGASFQVSPPPKRPIFSHRFKPESQQTPEEHHDEVMKALSKFNKFSPDQKYQKAGLPNPDAI